MGYAEAEEGLPGISICPRCGARLVTRNLWHSCGTFTLEGLFPRSDPAVLDLARKYVAMLYALGDVQVIPQKTRLTCVPSDCARRPDDHFNSASVTWTVPRLQLRHRPSK